MILLFLSCQGPATPGDSALQADTAPVADSGEPGETGVDSGDSGELVDTTTDVIVVGSGPAGVAAALSAEAGGANVILFEREDSAGSGLRLGGLAFAVNTPWQAAVGVEDSVDAAAAEWGEITGVSGDSAGPQRFFAESSATLEWLAARGAEIGEPLITAGGGSVARIHPLLWAPGKDPFESVMAGFSGDVRLGVEVTEPLLADGAVVGVRWREVASGLEGSTGARSVVLATGGFLRDLDTVATLRPDLAVREPLFETNPSSTGGGLPFLSAARAGADRPEEIGAYLHSVQDPQQVEGEPLIFSSNGPFILVGADGRRFTKDDALTDLGPMLDAPEGEVWVVAAGIGATAGTFSAPGYNAAEGQGIVKLTAAEVVALGSDEVFEADTLEELATLTGLGSGLVDEVEEFGARVAAGAADPFGRMLDPTDALVDPPWLALQVHPGLAKNFGGAATDVEGHVLDDEGAVIPGLYAAGEVAGMIVGGGSGTGFMGSVGACYQGGLAAGATAAAEAAIPE
ncbi:fumarate reductase [Deltaproteobacteria bacterium]|nr:fumarate reductase [Deltaproteobacteria bacterium]